MPEHAAIVTWSLIVVTCVVSIMGFRSYGFEEKYIFHPERILGSKEYYRLVTSAFLHADYRHLVFNMLTLYFFGPGVEFALGSPHFLITYLGAVVGGDLLSLYIHRHHDYRSYGASGGVCGILFASILLHPGGSIGMMFVPVSIPNWLYAVIFLLGSFYGMKEQNRGNIGHDAHLGGAIIGFLIAAAFEPEYVRFSPWIFGLVLGASLLLLVYLWVNPLMLSAPVAEFWPSRRARKEKSSGIVKQKQRQLQLDAVLEKISRKGIESLTPEEKTLLESASAEYRRRGDSKPPRSEFPI
jgi:membrane associated rhomboid family serine protease